MPYMQISMPCCGATKDTKEYMTKIKTAVERRLLHWLIYWTENIEATFILQKLGYNKEDIARE